jgi:hypothetical protein
MMALGSPFPRPRRDSTVGNMKTSQGQVSYGENIIALHFQSKSMRADLTVLININDAAK